VIGPEGAEGWQFCPGFQAPRGGRGNVPDERAAGPDPFLSPSRMARTAGKDSGIDEAVIRR